MVPYTATEIIERLELIAHPEGGFFRETYRSQGTIFESSLPANLVGNRCYSTAIYYLLKKGQHSKFHRLKSDELWHFHIGSPIEIIILQKDKSCKHLTLGSDLRQDQQLQVSIAAGTWFAARCKFHDKLGDFSLLSCTVSPGFDFQDFELADEKLLDALPDDEQYRLLV